MRITRKIRISLISTLGALTASLFLNQSIYAQTVNNEDLENAAASGEEWLSYGRDQAETRFSPLNQINDSNVSELGVAWIFDTDSYRGLESTPLVADGIMYATRAWSSVFALDARTGEQIWNFDPQVDKSIGWKACCDVVNRGVAIYEGKVFVGTIDGRLIALDAKNGNLLWQVQTTDQSLSYTVTSAPRVFDGKVIIGNSGAELGVRGYITAYDADSGSEEWRFWVVPGNPADGFENPDMEFAAETWSGDWWTAGGGGTSWDSLAYDPEARLVYVGTGNGSPWSHELRSNGEGDNLFLSSIVALNVDTGRVAWHYQTTPADNWDYTAVQQLILTELVIDGIPRQVIMQAPKNGFFYVIDRITGELLSADPYTQVTWASGVDLESGRPIETPQARYTEEISMITPGPGGGHNWHSMSFNPDTGLLYLPTEQGSSFPYGIDAQYFYRPGTWNLGVSALGSLEGVPFKAEDEYTEGTGPDVPSPGVLVAWDPIARKARWQINYGIASNGGTLTTAGNLVFQGIGDGHLMAYAADSGEKLWEVDLGVGIMAAPMTFVLDGKQYVSVLVGWGGTNGLVGPNLSGEYKAPGKLWTFELGGDQNIIPVTGIAMPELTAIEFDDSPEFLNYGADKYTEYCFVCHGTDAESGGVIADLRYASEATYSIIHNIVREGAYTGLGMPNLGKYVTEDDVNAIKNYILSRRAELMVE